MQETAGIGETVARIGGGLLNGEFVAHGGQRRHLRQEAQCRQLAVIFVVNIQHVVIKRRQRPNHRAHQRHRVRVTTKPTDHTRDLLMNHGMSCDAVDKLIVLFTIRRITVQHDVTHLGEITFLSQLLHRKPAMQQHAISAEGSP